MIKAMELECIGYPVLSTNEAQSKQCRVVIFLRARLIIWIFLARFEQPRYKTITMCMNLIVCKFTFGRDGNRSVGCQFLLCTSSYNI